MIQKTREAFIASFYNTDGSNLACFRLEGMDGGGDTSLLRRRARMANMAGVGLLSDVSNFDGVGFDSAVFFSVDVFLPFVRTAVLL